MKAKIFSVLMVVVMGVLMMSGCCWTRKSINPTYTPPPVQEVGVAMPVAEPVVLFPPVPTQQQPVMMVLEQPKQAPIMSVQTTGPEPQPQVQSQPAPKKTLMLHLFCEQCNRYYTWKGGQLPEGTELFYWHPEDKEWQRYGGDYHTIMRQPPAPERGVCPYHRR